MPSVPRESTSAPVADSLLRPYRFHGLTPTLVTGSEAKADCFLCGKPKLYISTITGLWQCKVCGESGNPLQFLRKLHEVSHMQTRQVDLEQLAQQRKPLQPASLSAWGICRSVIDTTWSVPGYNVAGSLVQLYRYCSVTDGKKRRMALLPTPQMGAENEGHKHGYFRADWNPKKRKVILAEGVWDAIAAWEGLRVTRENWDGACEVALSEAGSLYAEANVLAMPSASVFFPAWLKLLENKDVTLLTQNDLPKRNEQTGKITQVGLDSTKRVVAKIIDSGTTNKERISFLDWSATGVELKDGYDCRDWMAETGATHERFGSLLKLIRHIPSAWIDTVRVAPTTTSMGLNTVHCSSWEELLGGWKDALYWRESLDYVLSVMLAVAASTKQVGDSQLFLQVVGPPGSAKSKFCDAMLTSSNCYPLEQLTGFFSGWKSGEKGGKDFSLLSRINGKTLITSEGDVIFSSPLYRSLMSQQRRIFDGSASSSYKTLDEDRQYAGLRTPWILACTPKALEEDQSQVGDRFIRVCVEHPDADDRKATLRKVAFTALRSVAQTSNGQPDSCMDPPLLRAYQLTGGYVDYLRGNVAGVLEQLEKTLMDSPRGERVVDKCAALAEFTAWTRVQIHPIKDTEVTVELPTRLTHQFMRLACCLSVVLGRQDIDDDILRRIGRVAVDTAYGPTLRVANLLYSGGRIGFTQDGLEVRFDMEPKRLIRQLRMMKAVGLVEYYQNRGIGTLTTPKWRLTQKAYDLVSAAKE